MAQKKKLTFEEALSGLEGCADALRKEGATLDESLAQFQAGMEYYQKCADLLEDAKQKIQVYDKESGELNDYS